jgi:putative ABC transport system permease protein
VLATIGIYGVVSYAVNQRRREFGVRLALGAAPANVLRLVLRNSVGLIAAGAALGIAGALALGRFISAILYGIEAADTTTFSMALAVLISVASAACLIPARRAMRTNPSSVLRAD